MSDLIKEVAKICVYAGISLRLSQIKKALPTEGQINIEFSDAVPCPNCQGGGCPTCSGCGKLFYPNEFTQKAHDMLNKIKELLK